MPSQRSPHYDSVYELAFNHAEDLYEFHPEAFHVLSAEDQADLSLYFFVGRRIAVKDIFTYRVKLLSKDPTVDTRATGALKRFEDAIGS